MRRHFVVLATVSSVLLLASCASVEQEVQRQVHQGVQALFGAAKGYRIEFQTIPAGARIVCNGADKGIAPLTQYRELTAEQKSLKVLQLQDCEAVWPSGAQVEVRADIPLDQFPRFVNVVTERPSDVDGYEGDEQAGKEVLAKRQKQLEDIQRGVAALASLGSSIRQLSRNSAPAPTPSLSFGGNFRTVSSDRGIRWNWIQTSGDQAPSFQPFTKWKSDSQASWTPVYPASSCIGAVVMGRCTGTIEPSTSAQYCAGAFVNGRCAGSVLFAD